MATVQISGDFPGGFTVPAGDTWIIAGDVHIYPAAGAPQCGNVIVEGTLSSPPGAGTIFFHDINENLFVGGTPEGMPFTPQTTDAGIWVIGAGLLDFRSSDERPRWEFGVHPDWVNDPRPGDEFVMEPVGPRGDWDGFTTIPDISTFAPPVRAQGKEAVIMKISDDWKVVGEPNGKPHIFIHNNAPAAHFLGGGYRFLGPDAFSRYAIHLHHGRSNTDGTLVEATIRDYGNRGFVPHLSHGITAFNTLTYNWVAPTGNGGGAKSPSAYFWDRGGDNKSNHILWDRCLAARGVSNNGDEGRSSLFAMVAGFDCKVINSGAVGFKQSPDIAVTGSSSPGGFVWGEHASATWGFFNNFVHNVANAGILTWQNNGELHRQNGFTVLNSGSGIMHGAYNNRYQYGNMLISGCKYGINNFANSGNDGLRGDGHGLVYDNVIIQDCEIGVNALQAALPAATPVLFRNIQFINVPTPVDFNDSKAGDEPHPFDFVDCIVDDGDGPRPLHWDDVSFTSPNLGSKVRVQNGTEVWSKDATGVVITGLAPFYDTSFPSMPDPNSEQLIPSPEPPPVGTIFDDIVEVQRVEANSVQASFNTPPTPGNVLVALYRNREDGGLTFGSPQWLQPAELERPLMAQGSESMIWYRVADGSAADQTFVASETAAHTDRLILLEFSGIDPVNPVNMVTADISSQPGTMPSGNKTQLDPELAFTTPPLSQPRALGLMIVGSFRHIGTWSDGYTGNRYWSMKQITDGTPQTPIATYENNDGLPTTSRGGGLLAVLNANPIGINQIPVINASFDINQTPGNGTLTVIVTDTSTPSAEVNSVVVMFGGDTSVTGLPGSTFTHVFTTPGTHLITLDAMPVKPEVQMASFSVPVTVATPTDDVTADFTWALEQSQQGVVTFSESNVSAAGSPVSVVWDFGDGSSSTTPGVVPHTYAQNGIYVVSLTVSSPAQTKTTTQNINIDNIVQATTPPVLAVIVDAQFPEVGDVVPFHLETISDPDGVGIDISSIQWFITPPGGQPVQTVSPSVLADELGQYSINASANDNEGRPITATGSFVTNDTIGPNLSILVTPLSGDFPLTVDLTSMFSADTASGLIQWGDGASEGLASDAQYTYQSAGTFVILVTAMDVIGNQTQQSVMVTVTTPTTTDPLVISVAPTSGVAPLTVDLTANAAPTSGAIVNWGDGVIEDLFSSGFTHTYSEGQYVVAVAVGSEVALAGVTVSAAQVPNIEVNATFGGESTPLDQSFVQGEINVEVVNNSGEAIQSVEYELNGVLIGTTAGEGIVIDSDSLGNGEHVLRVTLTTASGTIESISTFNVSPLGTPSTAGLAVAVLGAGALLAFGLRKKK